MRIGVFGGSFDPPHAAHLQVARAAFRQLNLDRILWVPAFLPPHKNAPVTSYEHRAGMVKALIASEPSFEVSEIESTLPRPSYTLHTLKSLKDLHGTGHAWYLILGADNWAIFQDWHQPDAVMAEAALVIYPRQGIPLTDVPAHVTRLDCPEIPMESRFFRRELQSHPRETLEALPPPVADYIRKHRLYGFTS